MDSIYTRIYIIGMPASGKTTFGKGLSAISSYPFVDLDHVIEEREGQTIPTIFSEKGESYFREVERDVVEDTLPEQAIISTGGGAPCFYANIDFMLAHGIVLFLDTPTEELAKRANSQHGSRPLLNHRTGHELYRELEAKRDQRIEFYSQADIIIDGTAPNARGVWKEIEAFVKYGFKDR